MKKILYLFSFFLLTGCSMFSAPEKIPEIAGPRACLGDVCFSIEIADNGPKRQQGLMWREEMDANAGMLFIFDQERARRKFWMKNTLIALDMIWLDSDHKIVHIEEDVPPCEQDPCPSYGPDTTLSTYVLELNAGSIATLGSDIGDEVSIKEMEN